MLSGNKGEWSEVYVFLKLLADGRLNAADANLNVLPNVYYPIIKILRSEKGRNLEYLINGNIKVVDGNTNSIILQLPVATFIQQTQQLFNELKRSQKSSFSLTDIEKFLNSIYVHSLTALKTDKADIKIIVHDLNTGLRPKLGFSIKSMLGKKSTLFNAGPTTNFIFEIVGIKLSSTQIDKVNSITTSPMIKNRIDHLQSLGAKLIYSDIHSKNLKLNLQLIDSDLPEILGNVVLYKYSLNKSNIKDLVQHLNKINPKNFDLSLGHPFYEYKIKNFLTDSALGMTPATLWTGKYDATGGIIIVKKSGDLVCYHIYNRNEFQNYLLNNTKLEQASTSRYSFGNVYDLNGKQFIRLNLQIRFT